MAMKAARLEEATEHVCDLVTFIQLMAPQIVAARANAGSYQAHYLLRPGKGQFLLAVEALN